MQINFAGTEDNVDIYNALNKLVSDYLKTMFSKITFSKVILNRP